MAVRRRQRWSHSSSARADGRRGGRERQRIKGGGLRGVTCASHSKTEAVVSVGSAGVMAAG